MESKHYSDDSSRYLLGFGRALHYCLVPILVLLTAVLYLEFFAHVGHGLHEKLKFAEKLILFYFVMEVGTDFMLFEDKREFLSEKWFDILLIIPFLQTFRAVGRAGRLLRGVKAFKSLQLVQLSGVANSLQTIRVGKVPLVAGFVAGEGAGGIRLGKALPKFLKSVPKVQKFLHFLRELPSIIGYVPRAQSVIYLYTQSKLIGSKLISYLVPISLGLAI